MEADSLFSDVGRTNETKRILRIAVDAPTERFYKALANEVGVLGTQFNNERA